jgi:hypothetical protein
VAGRVGEVEGAVEDIRIPVIALGVGGVGDDGIRADELAQSGGVKTSIVVEQA